VRFHVYANTRLAGHRVMNCEIHNLPPLRCEAFQATECVRALVHTVLFTRALGVVFPVDKECELFDITYVTVGDPSVSRVVELRLVELAAWLDSKTKGKRETHTKVVVSFRESVGDVNSVGVVLRKPLLGAMEGTPGDSVYPRVSGVGRTTPRS
jgi:hypothetical protein